MISFFSEGINRRVESIKVLYMQNIIGRLVQARIKAILDFIFQQKSVVNENEERRKKKEESKV